MELRQLFLHTETVQNFEDTIEVLEKKLIDYSNKPDAKKDYVLNQKAYIENLKDYFIQSQQYIAQLERNAPINNYLIFNNGDNVLESTDNTILRKENKALQNRIDILERTLQFHNLRETDIAFLNSNKFQKETIRQASIYNAMQKWPELY